LPLIKELVDNEDEFLTLSKPYVDRIKEHYGQEIVNVSIILRGEGNGQSWKGSGNKNNPSSKNPANIKFFGVDSYKGVAVKMDEEYFNSLMEELKFDRCKVVFRKVFNSKEEILDKVSAALAKPDEIGPDRLKWLYRITQPYSYKTASERIAEAIVNNI
jgi:hypothetical protein